MQYKTDFQDDPPRVVLTVDGVGDVPFQTTTLDVTESTTQGNVHEKGIELVAKAEALIAEKEAEKAAAASRLSVLESLKASCGGAKEVKAEEVAAYKAELARIEAERLVKEVTVEPI